MGSTTWVTVVTALYGDTGVGMNEYALVKKSLRTFMPGAVMITMTSTVATFLNVAIGSYFLGSGFAASISGASVYTLLLSSVAAILNIGGLISFAMHRFHSDRKGASSSFTLTMVLVLVFGGAFLLVCLLTAPSVPPYAHILVHDYIIAVGFSAIPVMVLQICITSMWIDDDKWLSIFCFLVYVVADVVLEIFLFEGHNYAKFGPGICATYASLLSLLFVAFHYHREGRYMRLSIPSNISKDVKRLLKTGMRSFVNRASMIVRYSFLGAVIASSTVADMNCIGAQTTLFHLVMAIFSGTALMCAILTSWAYSEGNREGVLAAVGRTIYVGFAISVMITAIVLIASEELLVFIKNDYDIYNSSLSCLEWFAISIPTTTVSVSLIYAYQSTKRKLLSVALTVFRGAVAVIVPVTVLVPYIGPAAIWTVFLLSDLIFLLSIYVISSVHNRHLTRNLEDLLMLSGPNMETAPVFYGMARSDDTAGLLDRLSESLSSSGIGPETSEKVYASVSGILDSISKNSAKVCNIRVLVRSDEKVTVNIHDDADKSKDVLEGVKHYFVLGQNKYVASF